MKKYILKPIILVALFISVASTASIAHALTNTEINSVLVLLRYYGVSSNTIQIIREALADNDDTYHPLPLDTNITGKALLVSADEDKAFKWNHGPVHAADWKWSVTIRNSGKLEKMIERMTIVHNTSGEGWSTGDDANNPVRKGLYTLASIPLPCKGECVPFIIYTANLGEIVASKGEKSFILYGPNHYASQTFTGGYLLIEFTDGTRGEISIPASEITPALKEK